MRLESSASAGRELQILGTFLFMLGAGFVLDDGLDAPGWVSVLIGVAMLVWATRSLRQRQMQATANQQMRANGAETPPSDTA